jgi:hypothetical protein
MFLRHSSRDARRGVILIVVLALLTLFAIVGLSFVLYAQAEAESSRLSKESFTLRQPLESPDRMWSFALSQLLYDCPDDATGVYSGLRGHSLARSMYGFDNYIDANNNYVPNQTAFNGPGRNVFATVTTPFGTTSPETQLVNYTFYPNDPLAAGQLHDPERLGWRAGLTANPNVVTGGANVPYTYPDLNNMYLAAINAGGQVLMPSFHRPWLFGSNQPATNPNWEQTTFGKYLTLRPRPVDQLTNAQLLAAGLPAPLPDLATLTPPQQALLNTTIATLQANNQLLPYPEDNGGDVKNLYWLPGGNDSYWVDLGYPVQVAPDGRKYKPMFAFFITDLDNRINLNAHGNIRGGMTTGGPFSHVSNQGWGKWEVNIGNVLNTQNGNALTAQGPEWVNLFLGVPATGPGAFNMVTVPGKYGWDGKPNDLSVGNNTSPPGRTTHIYGQVDFDATQEFNNFAQTQFTPVLPGQALGWALGNAPLSNSFPVFPSGTPAGPLGVPGGYGNGYTIPVPPPPFPPFMQGDTPERLNHPSIYNVMWPAHDINAANPTFAPDNRPFLDDRRFSPFEMKALLNSNLTVDPNAAGAYGTAPQMANFALKSPLGLLLPFNFNDPLDIAGSLRRRRLVTTISYDVDVPGLIPWLFDPNNTLGGLAQPTYGATLLPANPLPTPNPVRPLIDDPDLTASHAPYGAAQYFPDPNGKITSRLNPPPQNSEFNIPQQPITVQGADWRSSVPVGINALNQLQAIQTQALVAQGLLPPGFQFPPPSARLDLSPLGFPSFPQYPDPSLGRTDDGGALQAQTLFATTARQRYADAIYRRLLMICGVPATRANIPTDDELMPRRWLAQLAVNIVDFIDSDDISTPFNFFTQADANNDPTYNPWAGDADTLTPNKELAAPRYWVFGIELPKVALNEVLVEYALPAPPPKTVTINVWTELINTMPAPASFPPTVDPNDALPIPLAVAAGALPAQTAYAPYRVVVAGKDTNGGGPLWTRLVNGTPPPAGPPFIPYNNDNVLGANNPANTRSYTDQGAASGFLSGNTWQWNGTAWGAAVVPTNIGPGQFFILGPGPDKAANFPDAAKTIPTNMGLSNALPTKDMTYTANVNTANGQLLPPDNAPLTVLLRRLANPRLPYNPYLTAPAGGPPAPAPTLQYPALPYNPYITIDYMESIPLNGYNPANLPGKPYYASRGKRQPYGAYTDAATAANSQVVDQGPGLQGRKPPITDHTFGNLNIQGYNTTVNPPVALTFPYDWLVHLDRQLVSPVELLHVSGYHPHELTHKFILPDPNPLNPPNPVQPWQAWVKYKHLAPWFDQSSRLYRLLELIESGDRAYGMQPSGRRPGRININTVWDKEILMALLDPQTANSFNEAVSGDVTQMFNYLMLGRTPNIATTGLSAGDRPFWGMGMGNIPFATPPGPPAPDQFFANGSGINDTFLRVQNPAGVLPSAQDPTGGSDPVTGRPLPRLFEHPRALNPLGVNGVDQVLGHPYFRYEPLNKIYNNLTTRSNVFAVWCTMGYFEVLDDSTRPVKLGAEIGKAAGTNIRHRFFGVVDRTEMVIARNIIQSAPGLSGTVVATIKNPTPPPATIPVPQNQPGLQWVQLDLTNPNVVYNYSANPTQNIVSGLTPTASGRNVAWTIKPGTVLVVDRGTINEEWIQVIDISPTGQSPPNPVPPNPQLAAYIQAVFLRPHGFDIPSGSFNGGFTITQPGNPGPQPPIDVRDYQHAPVVPVSVNLNN